MGSKTVVIIGAGFFGISAANRLVKSGSDVTVKLISLSNFTYFLISSIRVPVQNDTERTIYPIKDVLDKRVELIIDEVTNFNEKSVDLKEGETINFDALIIATGAKWADPLGYTHSFKNDYKKYFENQYNKIKEAKHIVLIGGGFNNIELIGELMYHYKEELAKGEKDVTMIHSGNLLLPNEEAYGVAMRERITNFLRTQKDLDIILDKRALVLEDGNTVEAGIGENKITIEADLIVSNTGIVPSVPLHSFDDFTNGNGFIKVEDTLQTKIPNIFAIGDVTDFLYKGLVYRGYWLDALIKNVLKIIECPSTPVTDMATVARSKGHVATVVSVGPEHGFGQVPLPWIGTVRIPSWYCVMAKSKDLVRWHGQRLFNS